jgi:hypothetical protein
MSREIVVKCCVTCPWRDYSRSTGFYCSFSGNQDAFELGIDFYQERQPWCPLDTGPITIKAGEP